MFHTQPHTDNRRFQGFAIPRQNWFKLPREWTDITAEMTSIAELKVVEYVLKHTWGYQEYGRKKQISLDEFRHGRKRKDGTRMDRGTGLSKPSVIAGLKSALKRGLLEEEIDDTDRARVKKSYALRMREDAGDPSGEADEPEAKPKQSRSPKSQPKTKHLNAGVRNLYPAVNSLDPCGQGPLHRTEKETSERNSKKPLNGIFHPLPALKQPKAKTEYLAQTILKELGDEHSVRFYRQVASKTPEDVIHRALAEIKADGAEHPAKLFTYKMKQYALQQGKAKIGGGNR